MTEVCSSVLPVDMGGQYACLISGLGSVVSENICVSILIRILLPYPFVSIVILSTDFILFLARRKFWWKFFQFAIGWIITFVALSIFNLWGAFVFYKFDSLVLESYNPGLFHRKVSEKLIKNQISMPSAEQIRMSNDFKQYIFIRASAYTWNRNKYFAFFVSFLVLYMNCVKGGVYLCYDLDIVIYTEPHEKSKGWRNCKSILFYFISEAK